MRAIYSVILLLTALIAALAGFAGASALTYSKRNLKDEYRWPWRYDAISQITQGWNGSPSHVNTLAYAVDFGTRCGTPSNWHICSQQPVHAAKEGVASCWDLKANGFGFATRIEYGSNGSDIYAHGDFCAIPGGTFVNVTQGRQIITTGTTGYIGVGDYADHLHFQKNQAGTPRTGTQVSTSFTMEGITNFADSLVNGNTLQSDNQSAGYSSSFAWEPAIHDKAFSIGWSTAGATASISGWTPGASGPCFAGASASWRDCNFTDVNSVSRAGRIQTFKGAGTPSGEHAIFKRSGASTAVFMSRALLGPYTDVWSGSNDGLYYVGYPLGDSYSIGGTSVRMDFQNGYATYNWSAGSSRWFWYSAFLGQYVEISLADYWD